MRWRQFESLIAGNAPMPEPGFAWALDFQVAGNAQACCIAVAGLARRGRSLPRQLALVYDWCQDLMTDAQRRDLADRIEKLMLAGVPPTRPVPLLARAPWPPSRSSTRCPTLPR